MKWWHHVIWIYGAGVALDFLTEFKNNGGKFKINPGPLGVPYVLTWPMHIIGDIKSAAS